MACMLLIQLKYLHNHTLKMHQMSQSQNLSLILTVILFLIVIKLLLRPGMPGLATLPPK